MAYEYPIKDLEIIKSVKQVYFFCPKKEIFLESRRKKSFQSYKIK